MTSTSDRANGSATPAGGAGPVPQPPVAAPAIWSFPTPDHDRLSNGIDVLTYRLPGQQVISAHLVLDVPLNAEDRTVEGVATMTTRVLDEGTRTHPGEEFPELLETEGAGFGVDVTLTGLQAVLDVPASHLDRALELFAEAVTEPVMADEDVDRHVQLRLAQIEQAAANSAQTASHVFRSLVFDHDSRAARMSGGESDTVAAVTGASVRDFHRGFVGPRGTTLILAGDFRADPVALAERTLGGWSNPDQRPVAYAAPTTGVRRAVVVDRPGAVQADLRLGGFGVDRLDPRWADLSVASYALGGAFLSRLNAVLREDLGYTYGVQLAFGPMRDAGTFAVQGSFRTDVIVDAVRRTRELIDLTGRPVTADEVADAVSYVVGVSPLRYATADGVTGQAGLQVLMGLGEDYVDRSLALLRNVTPESATAAYESLVRPDELTLVVVGDAETIAEPLRDLGFPDLEVWPG